MGLKPGMSTSRGGEDFRKPLISGELKPADAVPAATAALGAAIYYRKNKKTTR
jgi:hypothetical protein